MKGKVVLGFLRISRNLLVLTIRGQRGKHRARKSDTRAPEERRAKDERRVSTDSRDGISCELVRDLNRDEVSLIEVRFPLSFLRICYTGFGSWSGGRGGERGSGRGRS